MKSISSKNPLRQNLVELLPYALVSRVRRRRKDAIEKRILAETRKNIKTQIARYLATHSPQKLHIACGPNNLTGWLNTDISPNTKKGEVALDAREPLPFKNNSLDFIFSEHFIEHISLLDFRRLLKEIFRVLKPNGIVRLSTPDLAFVMGMYQSPSKETQAYINWYSQTFHPGELQKNTSTINGFFRNFGHQHLYDFQTLAAELKRAGFSKVTRFKPNQSYHSELANVEGHGKTVPKKFNDLESLVVEAEKIKNSR